MKVPLSWLKDFVAVDVAIEEAARRLTLAGLEVEEIRFVGLPLPPAQRHEARMTGLAWPAETFVVGAVHEVLPHPAADRLVLCRLDDGAGEHTVLTGAPNLFPFKGRGPLEPPLKVAYAREGARLYDGHRPGWELMTLKKTRIRGVDSASMACSEKELGISDDHEGVILLDDDAPAGMPLVDYMGDAVFEIAITPNMARNACLLGVARELAALTGQPLREPPPEPEGRGPALAGRVSITIEQPELNPRFVLGLIEGVTVGPSPYWLQRRLRLAGMRPINNLVDATNYVMLELGQPLHAFDYDVLAGRAGGRPPRVITRLPRPGERLTTLDGVARTLDDFTVLVADEAGALSIAGVMGGLESEIVDPAQPAPESHRAAAPGTRRVLLEGACWNGINIRRTEAAQRLSSEASYRFARGVHPALAARGVRRALDLMRRTAGGTVAQGLVDAYPLPPATAPVAITTDDVARGLGVRLETETVGELLARLGFGVARVGETLHVTPPDHRLDIGEGLVGQADLIEEIARLYGYDRIPETQIADRLPPQVGNPALEREEAVRDLLAALALQEVVTYRITSPAREARRLAPGAPVDEPDYVRLANPISADRTVMRRSLLASMLEVVAANARGRERIAFFEIAPVFLPRPQGGLPDEPVRLALALRGPRHPGAWAEPAAPAMDFFDLKGVIEALLAGLHLSPGRLEPLDDASFHPGKAARLSLGEQPVGVLGEIHPQVCARYDLPPGAVLAAELDLEALLAQAPDRFAVRSPSAFPPVLEDLAVVVDEGLVAEQVEACIRQAGAPLLQEVRLFDLYRGEQIGPGKKSLAYALTYQAPDRTLTDEEAARVRARIVRSLAQQLGATLRA